MTDLRNKVEVQLKEVWKEKGFSHVKALILKQPYMDLEKLYSELSGWISNTLEYSIYRGLFNYQDRDKTREQTADLFTVEARKSRLAAAFSEVEESLILEKLEDDGTFKLDLSDDWLSNLERESNRYKIPSFRKEMNERALAILDKDPKDITVLDKMILKNYTGKGGIGEEGVEILTQYFTDYKTINFVYDKLRNMGFPLSGINALEPSCGIGSFMGLSPKGINWDAIDIDSTLTEMVKILYPKVNVMNKSFEEHRKDNFYDLVITNVPFSNSRGMGLVKDKPDIRKLHDYFILASLDKLKPNGMAVLILPASVLDSINPKIREMISNEAEVVTAYRLPDKVFEKTGTDTVTDILFLRKRVPNSEDATKVFKNNEDFKTLVFPEAFQKNNRQLPLNKFYESNPNNVLGRMEEYKNRYGQFIIKVTGTLDSHQITKALGNNEQYTPADVESVVEEEESFSLQEILRDKLLEEVAPIGGMFKVAKPKEEKEDLSGLNTMERLLRESEKTSWYVREVKKKDGLLRECAKPVSIGPDIESKVEAILNIANIALSMREYAREGNKYMVRMIRQELKQEVDSFKDKYPYVLENNRIKKVMMSDPRYSIVKVLCNDPDIFKEDTITKKTYNFTLNDPTNLVEVCKYLILRDRKITTYNFSRVYKGGTHNIEEAEEILNNSMEVFKKPSFEEKQIHNHGNITTMIVRVEPSYELAIDYLSGNIHKKLEFARREVENGNAEYQKNIEALEKVLPKKRTLNDIKLSIRHKWIDLSVIETFVRRGLGYAGFNVLYDDIKRTYEVSFSSYHCNNYDMKKKLDIGRDFTWWIEKYLNVKELLVTDSDGYKDVVATAKLTEKMKIVDELFMSYLKSTPEVAAPILEKYNYVFNNTVAKDYSEEELIIPEVGEGWQFRKNQLEAASMALSIGKYCNSHRVGAGKTATSALVNHMLKVLGRANKPVQVVPGKVLKKFVRDIKEGSRGLTPIFPNMKILDVTEYSFDEALAMIAYNNWDLVLIPDTWFKRIAMTPEREMAYIEEQIRNLEISELSRAYEKGLNRQQKEYENRIQNLKAKLAELRNYVKRDGLFFEDLGIDSISLDECQSVKNLVSSVRGSELGISATPSQIALDFNMKAQYIMEINNGNNVFLYTATPVSNSILEIYGLLLNIAPHEWESRSIYTADDFIDFFADTSVTYGITKENEVGVVRKIDGFINLDDLRNLFGKYVDFRVSIGNMELPDLEETRIVVDMTLGQRIFFNSLLERLKDIPDDKSVDNVLKILIEGRQASISESLFSHLKPTRENSPKISACISLVSKIYKETGGNQLIFLDQYGKSVLGKEDLHSFIAEELVKEGIPENEIVIINGSVNANREKKLQIQDAFNDGVYKVLIGTTDSIGAGMDLQEQTIASHNLDIPWTPTSVEQKEGRMNRPGNRYAKVLNINYYVRGSYDAWSASIVAIKKKWQDQLLLGGMDSIGGYTKNKEDDSWNMETIMAEIMENPVEKAKLNYKAKHNNFIVDIKSLEENIAKKEQEIADILQSVSEREEKIKEYQKDLDRGEKVKLAKMRIEQLSKTCKGLMEECNSLTSTKESYERELKEKKRNLASHEANYEGIIAAASKKETNTKEQLVDTDKLVEDLKIANANVVLPQKEVFNNLFSSEIVSSEEVEVKEVALVGIPNTANDMFALFGGDTISSNQSTPKLVILKLDEVKENKTRKRKSTGNNQVAIDLSSLI